MRVVRRLTDGAMEGKANGVFRKGLHGFEEDDIAEAYETVVGCMSGSMEALSARTYHQQRLIRWQQWRKFWKVCHDLGFKFRENSGWCRGCQSERKLSALRKGYGNSKAPPPANGVAMGGQSRFGQG